MQIPTTKGKCLFCSKLYSKAGFTRHLKTCKDQKVFFDTHYKKIKREKKLYYLAIYAKYDPEFWMHILIDGKQALDILDNFLRNIWLECCGHLSEFKIDGIRYASTFDEEFDLEEDVDYTEDEIYDSISSMNDSEIKKSFDNYGKLENFTSDFLEKIKATFDENTNPNEILSFIDQTIDELPDKEFEEFEKLLVETFNTSSIPTEGEIGQIVEYPFLKKMFMDFNPEVNDQSMDVKIQNILSEKTKFNYVYDFGSSTELTLKVIKIEKINYNFNSFIILARNELPKYPCSNCDNTSEFLCGECMYEGNNLVCISCAKQHKHESDEDDEFDTLIKLDVNSPRFGICGYFG